MGRFEEKSSLSVLLLLIHRSGACRRRPGRRTGSVGSPADKQTSASWYGQICIAFLSLVQGGGFTRFENKEKTLKWRIFQLRYFGTLVLGILK